MVCVCVTNEQTRSHFDFLMSFYIPIVLFRYREGDFEVIFFHNEVTLFLLSSLPVTTVKSHL